MNSELVFYVIVTLLFLLVLARIGKKKRLRPLLVRKPELERMIVEMLDPLGKEGMSATKIYSTLNGKNALPMDVGLLSFCELLDILRKEGLIKKKKLSSSDIAAGQLTYHT